MIGRGDDTDRRSHLEVVAGHRRRQEPGVPVEYREEQEDDEVPETTG